MFVLLVTLNLMEEHVMASARLITRIRNQGQNHIEVVPKNFILK